MAINLHDQPDSSYFDFDVLDTELSNEQPPHEYQGFRGVGPAEIIGFAVIVLVSYPIIHWLASALAEAIVR